MHLARPDPYAVIRLRNYRCFLLGRSFFFFALQLQGVAVSWEIYQRLHTAPRVAALALGNVGLVQVIPVLTLAIPAGYVIDHFSRRLIVLATQALFLFGAISLILISHFHAPIYAYYLVLLNTSIGAAFSNPANTALFPTLVPRELIPSASTWNSSVLQFASVLGPGVGGFLVANGGPEVCYILITLCAVSSFTLLSLAAPIVPLEPRPSGLSWHSLLGGVKFVINAPVLLGILTLELFAILFGGVAALLPIFAHDFLGVGATGFGILRAAPAVGAISMALFTLHASPWKRPGRVVFMGVTGYGVATLVFGFSKVFWLSALALALIGVCDNLNTVILQTVAQLITPDQLRGRVSAITFMFFGFSNQIGQFESGLTASLFGLVGSVAFGGIVTLAVVLIGLVALPQVRELGPLHELKLRGGKE